METKKDLLYTQTHEWVKIDGNQASVGLSDYAQDAIGDIVFVEMPPDGTALSAGDSLGAVESVKAASEIYSPVSGKVVKTNDALTGQPELLNQQPYDSWIAVLDISGEELPDTLMDEAAYLEFCRKEHD